MKNISGYISVLVCFLLISELAISNVQGEAHNPLDPLSAEEIQETVYIIHASIPVIQHSGTWIFNWITLKEPEKHLLLPYFLQGISPPPYSVPRKAFVNLVERTRNLVTELVVNLDTRKVESWDKLPLGTQPAFTDYEHTHCVEIAKKEPRVQERIYQMGFYNLSLVMGSCWTIQSFDKPLLKKALLPMYIFMYGKLFERDNQYAHPFDFMVAIDFPTEEILYIENVATHSDYNAENRNGNICPKKSYLYDPELLPANFLRRDVHPVLYIQPQGAGYQIKGNEISWQKFNFRIGFNGKESFIINQVSYQDGALRRPLFYRLSISELFIPYGDPRPPFHQKQPYDMGDFSMGVNAQDLKKAGICRGGVVSYLSFYIHNEAGQPLLRPNVVCIHEEDHDILWAKTVPGGGPVVHTRSTRLTVTTHVNFGGYDYRLSWRFYQDASIEFNWSLLGTVSPNMLAVNVTETGFGSVVQPQIGAQYHQHTMAIRIDAEIDGDTNTVSTVDVVPLPDPSGSARNPYGNGFTTLETVLKTQAEARTNINPAGMRTWNIKNLNRIHPYTKKPVGWKLHPFNNPKVFMRKDSPMHGRAAYTDYNLWVTRYQDDQLYVNGIYYKGGHGLVDWVNREPNADVTDTDVVLWYIFGLTHIPRVEDWPVMPIDNIGFTLRPTNFFLQNPALDVPPPPKQQYV